MTDLAPVRTITRGPQHHWFGYYDKHAFDPSGRLVLANRVDFEDRSPRPEDEISVGLIDTADEMDLWYDLGTSRAWGWQQGCMLQWRPAHDRQVIWNDRDDRRHRFVSHLLDLETNERRTLPHPIYALTPDGRSAVTADFARIQRMRPGYGYAGLEDPYADERAPKDSGVWRIDLDTGDASLIVSLAELARKSWEGRRLDACWHYVNHLLPSPDGERLLFLHRWRNHMRHPAVLRALTGFQTRLFSVRLDGSDLYELDPSGHTSHFIWRDPEHVCAWTRPIGRDAGFWLLHDRTRYVEPVGVDVMTRNGHNTYLPGTHGEWILNDTYPDLWTTEQTLYLFHVPTGRRIDLGRFPAARRYFGERRCDLHPRASRDGRTVAIDSTHTGEGRQVHLVDVGAVLDAQDHPPRG